MKLLANGKDSGLAAVLSLKNQWKHTFTDLPMYDSDGNLIDYRVEETPISDKWMVEYGEIVSSGTSPPAYSTTVTNTYVTGGPELPSTGTSARLMYVLCGGSMMLTSLVYGILLRRKRERRMK
ncbi:MAG: Cna B-type domain-containing protein [Mailhella sp.]|nr:Cna B-type domain-containing protein [Mailhella sp.]